MAKARITVDELHHCHGETATLAGLSFEVGHGEVLAVVGPSGCGKSTLLSILAGLEQPSSGRVMISVEGDAGGRGQLANADSAAEKGNPAAVDDRLLACALMPQRDLLLPWFDALDNAALALRNRGVKRREARATAASSFARFGLAGFERMLPHQLSGGMRQRVAFLRTLLAGKSVLLLDEPFAALDAITRGDMHEWLAATLADAPRTVVLVTHDVEEALLLADRVLVLTPRPARIAGMLISPSREHRSRLAALADPNLVALRQQALAMLARQGDKADPDLPVDSAARSLPRMPEVTR